MSDDQTPDTIESIAIIGMAGRFPEARDLDELWRNLLDRRDCIRDLTDDDLRQAGLDPATLPPNYVRCDTHVDGIELFDASFFGFSAREAGAALDRGPGGSAQLNEGRHGSHWTRGARKVAETGGRGRSRPADS